jgi:hypothetical protein
MTLTPADLEALTGKRRPAAQRAVLSALGIAHKVRPDGTLAVLRVVAELALGHTVGARSSAPKLRLPAQGVT